MQISVSPYLKPIDLDQVKRYRDAGVDQVIVLARGADRNTLLAGLDELAARIVAPAAHL